MQGYHIEVRPRIRDAYGMNLPQGCQLHPDCYSCPYPDCMLTVHGTPNKSIIRHMELQRQIPKLRRQGMSIKNIARALHADKVTVNKILMR